MRRAVREEIGIREDGGLTSSQYIGHRSRILSRMGFFLDSHARSGAMILSISDYRVEKGGTQESDIWSKTSNLTGGEGLAMAPELALRYFLSNLDQNRPRQEQKMG